MPYQRKYGVLTTGGTNIMIPMVKAGIADFATGSDWTPAAGDVKVSKDGGTQANITNLPTYSNGQWIFVLTAAELTAKTVNVAVVDSATKAVEDNFFCVETVGNASAQFAVDPTDGSAFGLALLATIAGYIDTEIAAIKTKTDFLPSVAAGANGGVALAGASGRVQIDLTDAVPTSNTANTIGDCLNAARADGFGKRVITGTTDVLYGPDNTTAVKTFTLNSSTAPTSRT